VSGLRTLEYHVLRTCERLGLSEREFRTQSYAAQIRQLAYGWLRSTEESGNLERVR
jgi:hypothetical protein